MLHCVPNADGVCGCSMGRSEASPCPAPVEVTGPHSPCPSPRGRRGAGVNRGTWTPARGMHRSPLGHLCHWEGGFGGQGTRPTFTSTPTRPLTLPRSSGYIPFAPFMYSYFPPISCIPTFATQPARLQHSCNRLDLLPFRFDLCPLADIFPSQTKAYFSKAAIVCRLGNNQNGETFGRKKKAEKGA